MEKIIILGKGGHAGSLVDALERENKYEIAGYVVNAEEKETVCDRYPIIGNDTDLKKIFQSGIKNAALGIGFLGKSDLRERLWETLKGIGFMLPVICDSSAILARNVQIGEGSFIGKGAVVNANACIGKMCIINTGAIIEHDCKVEDFSHISVGSVLCGNVQIGKSVLVGANATVIQGVTVGDKCVIGAGTTVRRNVEECYMVYNNEKTVKVFGGGYKLIPGKRCAA